MPTDISCLREAAGCGPRMSIDFWRSWISRRVDSAVPAISPDALNAVVTKNPVRRNDRTTLFKSLRHKQAIERISVVEGQRCQLGDVTELDGNLPKGVRTQQHAHQL